MLLQEHRAHPEQLIDRFDVLSVSSLRGSTGEVGPVDGISMTRRSPRSTNVLVRWFTQLALTGCRLR